MIVTAGLVLAGCGRRDIVLARVGARTITVSDLRTAAASGPRGGGDTSTPNLRPVLDALVTRALMLEAASDLRRQGALGPGDSLREHGSSGRSAPLEQRLLDAVYRIEVLDRVAAPDSSALRVAWSLRPEARGLSAADVACITVSDSSLAEKLRTAIRSGRGLAAAGKLISPALIASLQSLRFPSRDPRWQRLEAVLATMSTHQVRGPLRVAGGWMFVELLNRKGRQPSIDELSPSQAMSFRNEVLDQARDARFGSLMDSLAAAIAPQIFSDRLDRVRLTLRTHPLVLWLGWTLVFALVLGLGLRFAPLPVGAAWLQTFGRIGFRIGLVGLLILLAGRYVIRHDLGGWDFVNYHRAAREMRAGMSPYDPETVAKDNWDPATPFLYAPVTLWLFSPLCGLPLETAVVVWFWIKMGCAVVLGVLSWRVLAGRCPLPVIVAIVLYGFDGALLLDLRAGNVSTLETLLLWGACVALLNDRRWLCACLIAIAAQFKLLPIVFLSLLLWPTRNYSPRIGPILAGLGLFGVLLTVPNVAGLPWADGYLHNLESARPFGEVNPSALGLTDMLLAHGGADGGHSRVALAVWAAYCIALLAVSVSALRRAWRRQEPMDCIVVSIMLFILLSPRPIVYGYSLAVVPALLIVLQLWPRPWGTAVAVVALASEGLVQRAVMHADFLPVIRPWFLYVGLANSPFLLALGLWLAFAARSDLAPPSSSQAVTAFMRREVH